VPFEGIEIAIVMEEWKAALDAEGGDPTIHNFADRESPGSKLTIIYSALDRIPTADHQVDWEV